MPTVLIPHAGKPAARNYSSRRQVLVSHTSGTSTTHDISTILQSFLLLFVVKLREPSTSHWDRINRLFSVKIQRNVAITISVHLAIFIQKRGTPLNVTR